MSAAGATYTRGSEKSTFDQSPFGLIVCGVDGSPSSLEGVRQADALAGASSTIELVAVVDEWGSGPTAGALLSEARAKRALARAATELAGSPAHVLSRTVHGLHAWQNLLEEAAGADLLVVGRHGYSRIGGILVGSTATKLLHAARAPVLVAVKPPNDEPFPGRILVGADGPDHPEHAITLAGRIAKHSRSDITLLRVDWSHRAKRPEIADAVAEVVQALGSKPFEILVGGSPERTIQEYATRERASLVITGSRNLTGMKAARSVSERVAHDAPCSVLVLRDRGAAAGRS